MSADKTGFESTTMDSFSYLSTVFLTKKIAAIIAATSAAAATDLNLVVGSTFAGLELWGVISDIGSSGRVEPISL